MDDKRWDREKVDYLTGKAVEHAWQRHEKHFLRIGIDSPEQLKAVVDEGLRDPKTRSFDRQADPQRGQNERSQVFEIGYQNSGGETHRLGVVLNPDRDETTGALHGGTVVISDPNRRADFSRWLLSEYQRGQKPELLLRGQDSGVAEGRARTSPLSRLDAALKREPTMIEKMQGRQKIQGREGNPDLKPEPPSHDL